VQSRIIRRSRRSTLIWLWARRAVCRLISTASDYCTNYGRWVPVRHCIGGCLPNGFFFNLQSAPFPRPCRPPALLTILIPIALPAAAPRGSPCFTRDNRGKTLLRPARGLKAAQNPCDFKDLNSKFAASGTTPTGEKKGRNSRAKSDNRGATGWRRQWRGIPHVPHLSEVTSCRIRCEFGNFFVAPKCEDHQGRPPGHERPRAARARPTSAATAARSPPGAQRRIGHAVLDEIAEGDALVFS
jgi:hypothetical protein